MTPRLTEMPTLARSLSARLLVLTISFVMLAEVLIYAPSIARFRLSWLEERIAAAHLATLALEATPSGMVSPELERELLRHVGGYGVILYKPDSKNLMLSSDMPPKVDVTVDLAKMGFVRILRETFLTLTQTDNRVLQVMGPSPKGNVVVAVVLDETPLREEMYAFSQRILLLSIVISLFTAALVYLTLHLMMVVPMRRITAAMIAFRDNPEAPASTVTRTDRGDEIGIAERELVSMQDRLRTALRQRKHLAALGEAVAKINHDLRNMLAAARLVSERLAQSADPEVKRDSSTLERAIDRAAALCTQTLHYVDDRRELRPRRFRLAAMLREVGQIADGTQGALRIEMPDDIGVTADREELFRVFVNLVRNALDAGAKMITIRLAASSPVRIEVADDGPGMPPRAVENLFRAFAGSARAGGTGLGLAIAREVMAAHGGSIELMRTGADGTVFCLTLPGDARAASEAAE
jgi:signal transduction histidine kinase